MYQLPKKYTYRDSMGSEHCATTVTYDHDESPIETGAEYCYTVEDGGDCTVSSANKFSKRELSISAMGTGRG